VGFHRRFLPIALWFLTFELSLHFFVVCIAAQQGKQEPSVADEPRVGPYVVGKGVNSPVALFDPLPFYTEEARAAGIEGIVLLQLVVRKDGTAGSFKVLHGLGYGLDQSAISTVANKWRFRPGTYNGVPADVQILIEVSFRLDLSETQRAKLKAYPLRVSLLQTEWNRNNAGGWVGNGYGNVKDGDSFQGFVFTCTCTSRYNLSQSNEAYSAKWKKPGSRLEIVGTQVGDSQKQNRCELKVTVKNLVYMLKDGNLVSVSIEQWEQTRKILEIAAHPTDIDPAHYPLEVALLEMSWESHPLGGYTGTGRGNVRDKDILISFDFSTLCPERLTVNLPGSSYRGRWEQEATRLLVLATTMADSNPTRICELRTRTRPDSVYVKNPNTGILTVVTQDEYRRQAQNAQGASQSQKPLFPLASSAQSQPVQKSPAPDPGSVKANTKLTNSDVISMVNSGLSIDVILAKISTSQCAFDTSPEALRQLSAAHVPDKIVIEMIKRSDSR
jgi:TonB family protein